MLDHSEAQEGTCKNAGANNATSEVRNRYRYPEPKEELVEHYAQAAVSQGWTKDAETTPGSVISFTRIEQSRTYMLDVKYDEHEQQAFDVILSVNTPADC